MLQGLIAALLGPGSGILTGLFGTGIQGVLKYFGDKQRFAHELAMRGKDIEAMEKEHALRLREAEVKYAGERDLAEVDLQKAEAQAAADIRSASYANDKATYWNPQATGWIGILLALVDVFRGTIRPGLTAYLVIIVSVFGFSIWMHTAISASDATEMLARILMSLLFLTETAVTWWFGSQAIQKLGAHSRKAV